MDQLLRQVQEMGRAVDESLKEKALTEGAEIFRDSAKDNVNVRTGTLKDNIIISDIEGDEVHVGPDQQGTAFYGHILEIGRRPGTSNGYKYPGMAARPFMGPAFENNKEAVQQKMAEVIKRELGL